MAYIINILEPIIVTILATSAITKITNSPDSILTKAMFIRHKTERNIEKNIIILHRPILASFPISAPSPQDGMQPYCH